jgi:hypothetical protein
MVVGRCIRYLDTQKSFVLVSGIENDILGFSFVRQKLSKMFTSSLQRSLLKIVNLRNIDLRKIEKLGKM